MKAIQLTAHGGLEVLDYVDVPDPEPGSSDVIVEVEACALNRLDVAQRNGWFTVDGFAFPHIPGMDVAGTVVAVGPDVQRVRPGTRVVIDPSMAGVPEGSRLAGRGDLHGDLGIIGANADGGYAQLCLAPETHVYEIPAGMSSEHAATFPTVFMTAGHALFEVAEIGAGDTVLIHAAGSGVSVAAIQLAARAGATILATAGSESKLEQARRLGAHHVANNRTSDVTKWAREVTDGRGVDVVFDHVGQALFEASVLAMAVGGRLVCCGNTSGDQASIPSLGFMFHNEIRILGSGPYRPQEFAPLWRTFCDGDFANVVHREFDLAAAGDAQRALEDGDVFGKIVLRP